MAKATFVIGDVTLLDRSGGQSVSLKVEVDSMIQGEAINLSFFEDISGDANDKLLTEYIIHNGSEVIPVLEALVALLKERGSAGE